MQQLYNLLLIFSPSLCNLQLNCKKKKIRKNMLMIKERNNFGWSWNVYNAQQCNNVHKLNRKRILYRVLYRMHTYMRNTREFLST